LPPSESRLPAETGSMTQSTGKIIPHHPILTWQLVSSATDIEQNEDMMQTAALPLKGYRIYSEAASQRD
ncbi:MAG TPA: hypothetical protein HPQ00_11315, partial [Magnetococcales bacterium]|nr:hypothetical protein [Magnetococcales bacterium]